MFNHYDLITTILFELFAALSGSLYLRHIKQEKLRVFVYYLWLTVVAETLGLYPFILQHNFDYEWFIALKNSPFCSNIWLYNIYAFLAIGFIGVFYSDLLNNKLYALIIKFTFIVYCLFAFLYFILSDAFFIRGLPYKSIIETMLIVFWIILYLIDLMKSKELLRFYKFPTFYISITLLFWYIIVTPLFIFDEYFKAVNAEFVRFRNTLLFIINLLTYSCFTFGFLYSLYKRKQFKKN